MIIDETKLQSASAYNTFKNNTSTNYTFAIPSTLANGSGYTYTKNFTFTGNINFIELYIFATEYGEYFRYLDNAYHNSWMVLNTVRQNYLLLSSGGLWDYGINYTINGNVVSVTLSIFKNSTGSTITFSGSLTVPIVFVDYTIA